MKKFLLLFFLIPTTAVSMERAITEYPRWREKFKNIDQQTLTKKLGYNPQLELLQDNNPDVIHQGGPTVYLHGWKSSADAFNVRKRCNDSNKIPGDVIVFNFPDASLWINNTIPYWMPLSRSNFAQENDIKTVLCVIKTLHSAGITPPVYYPHSRGGAAMIKVIGILNKPSEEWQTRLQQWDITEKDRLTILDSIKITYLNTPLKNVRRAVQKFCENKCALVTYFFPALQPFISETVTNFVHNKLSRWITSYDPADTKEPIAYFNDWENLPTMTVLLHFQHGDNEVPNDDDGECAQKLLEVKPENSYVIVGNNGGHESGDIAIAQVIHRLNLGATCSYLNDDEKLRKGLSILVKETYSAEKIKTHVEAQHRNFAAENLSKQRSPLFKVTCLSAILVFIAYRYMYLLLTGGRNTTQ